MTSVLAGFCFFAQGRAFGLHARIARMPNHTAYAAHAAEQAGAAAQYTSVAPALYRAALGAVNPDHYLAAFERLDGAGRVLPGWNMAAALCPLGWLVFRRLWRQALLLALGLVAGALLLWAGYQWLAVPLPMLAGVALAGLLMPCAGLGLYGDALVHADVRRRIAGAVSAAPNMREAMALLQRQAVNRRGLLWLVVMGMGLVLAGFAAWWIVDRPMTNTPVRGAVVAAVVADPEPAPRPMQEEPPPALQAASEPDAARPALVADPSPAAVVQPPVAQEPVPLSEPPAPTAVALPTTDAPRVAAEPQAQRAVPAAEPAPAKAAQRRLYINVGLFADPENARRAHARLRQVGLPSTIEPLLRADGSRLQRVRVGPFTSAAQANAAVARVRALGLEAVAAAQ